MPEIDNGPVRIHYDDVGSGEPLLLMHGGMASCEYWRLAGYVDALADDYRLIMPDFRGHGASSRPHEASTYGLAYDVADVLAVLDAAGVESATACGWSWGGSAGLGLAALHPERVRAVLAIGCSGRHVRFSDVPADFSRFDEIADRIEADGLRQSAGEVERLGGRPWLRETFLANDRAAMAAWYRAQPVATAIGCSLADVAQPVRFIAGEDEVPTLNFPQPLLPPQAELEVLAGENHVSAFLRVDVVVPALRRLSVAEHTTRQAL